MAVNYLYDVATVRPRNVLLLLRSWKGSIQKLIYVELLVYLLLYLLMSICYRLVSTGSKTEIFILAYYINRHKNNEVIVGLSFVLGFVIHITYRRFWKQFLLLPWPDSFALQVTSCFISSQQPGDSRERLLRRALVRYANVSIIDAMSNISMKIKNRFPSPQHYIAAGLLDENEANAMFGCALTSDPALTYLIPLGWCASIINRARRDKVLRDEMAYNSVLVKLDKIRMSIGNLFIYDWQSVPLSFVQVVIVTAYSYFVSCLITRQFFFTFGLEPSAKAAQNESMTSTASSLSSVTTGPSGPSAAQIVSNATESVSGFLAEYFVDTIRHGHTTFPFIDHRNISAIHDKTSLYARFDIFVPIFTIIQFAVYVGWIKISVMLLRPFGEFDSNIDVETLIDRHILTSYLVVDELHDVYPILKKDEFFDVSSQDIDLPYTVATQAQAHQEVFFGSVNLHPSTKAFANMEYAEAPMFMPNEPPQPVSIGGGVEGGVTLSGSDMKLKQQIHDEIFFMPPMSSLRRLRRTFSQTSDPEKMSTGGGGGVRRKAVNVYRRTFSSFK